MAGSKSFHEVLVRKHRIKGSSNRSFGFTVGAILLLVAAARAFLVHLAWLEISMALGGAILLILALARPQSLTAPNNAWTILGLLLFRIVNPVVMGVIFITTVIPTGLLMKLAGKDPLRLKFDPQATSYWIDREPPGPPPDSMRQQF